MLTIQRYMGQNFNLISLIWGCCILNMYLQISKIIVVVQNAVFDFNENYRDIFISMPLVKFSFLKIFFVCAQKRQNPPGFCLFSTIVPWYVRARAREASKISILRKIAKFYFCFPYHQWNAFELNLQFLMFGIFTQPFNKFLPREWTSRENFSRRILNKQTQNKNKNRSRTTYNF